MYPLSWRAENETRCDWVSERNGRCTRGAIHEVLHDGDTHNYCRHHRRQAEREGVVEMLGLAPGRRIVGFDKEERLDRIKLRHEQLKAEGRVP